VLASIGLLAVFAYVVALNGWRIATLFGLGSLMGLVLYHAAFGFTAAYRRMIVARDVSGVQVQLLMLAVATVLFVPALAEGAVFGRSVSGAIAPVGVQVAAGAFMFGLGMQLGGGCGSGTLFTVGGGSIRMLVTLAAFVAGSFWASLHMEWWVSTPRVPGIALGDMFGWSAALVAQLAVFLVLWLVLRRWGGETGSGSCPADTASFPNRRMADCLGGVHIIRCKDCQIPGMGSDWCVVLDRRVYRKGVEQQHFDR
jgi:uncharacterized membrane protein YedE/YeeE